MKDQGKFGIGKALTGCLAVIAGCASLFGVYHGVNLYVDSRIQDKLSNPTFLRHLARSVRPSVVFDDRESIIADQGAMSYLTKIAVIRSEKDSFTIKVTPSEYTGVEPILEPLDFAYAIDAERGPGYDWIFHLRDMGILTHNTPKDKRPQRFRLELIR